MASKSIPRLPEPVQGLALPRFPLGYLRPFRMMAHAPVGLLCVSHAHKSTIDNTPPFCRIVLDRCTYFSAWLDPLFGISLGDSSR